MEHTDAGVHTVLADVERPADHYPYADHPDRVLTERPTEATAEVVARPPVTPVPAVPVPAGLVEADETDSDSDGLDEVEAVADYADDIDDATEVDGVDELTDGQALAPVIDLGLDDLFGEAMEWQERALCAQTDPEAFFPEKGGSTREAKRICSGCEVRAECLEYALENDERFGIWGGMSERERRKQRRRAV